MIPVMRFFRLNDMSGIVYRISINYIMGAFVNKLMLSMW